MSFSLQCSASRLVCFIVRNMYLQTQASCLGITGKTCPVVYLGQQCQSAYRSLSPLPRWQRLPTRQQWWETIISLWVFGYIFLSSMTPGVAPQVLRDSQDGFWKKKRCMFQEVATKYHFSDLFEPLLPYALENLPGPMSGDNWEFQRGEHVSNILGQLHASKGHRSKESDGNSACFIASNIGSATLLTLSQSPSFRLFLL